MKRLLCVMIAVAILYCPAALAQNTVNWDSRMSLPSLYEQQTYKTSDVSPYIVCWYDFGGADRFWEYSVDFRAEHLPRGTYLSIASWEMGSDQLDREYVTAKGDYANGGYCGFQVWEDGTHAAILTIWDKFCTDKNGRTTVIRANQIYPENGRGSERDDNGLEGSFLHCLIPYDWKEDHDYRALLQIGDNWDTRNAHIIFWVCDLENGAWTRLMEFELGYGEAYMNGFCSFLENYLPQFAGEVRSMILSNCQAHPYGGNWVGARSGYLLQNFDHPGSYNFGAEGNKFWAITTGLSGRCPVPKEGWYSVSYKDGDSPY